MPIRAALTGMTFGRLGVIGYSHSKHNVYWRCVCICGTERIVDTVSLNSGHTRSCGCLRREVTMSLRTAHGHSRVGRETKLYQCWKNMLQRCDNPRKGSYKDYGARGIRVCERWRTYEHFLSDMGEPPHGSTLERIDTDGHYEPANCRWASRAEQARNKRDTRFLTFQGKTLCVAEWARLVGLPRRCIQQRLDTLKWTVEEALTRPHGRPNSIGVS